MYKYFDNKQLQKEIQRPCSSLIKELEDELRRCGVNSQAFLIGSGGKNLITQNEDGPIDFDYNLNILSCENINDCRAIKELVRKSFNNVMRKNAWDDVDDSTSSLTTKKYSLKAHPNATFSIDLAIVMRKNNKWFRLKHKKTGYFLNDQYFWNEAPNSLKYSAKVKEIKNAQCWILVRNQYLKIKNRYLRNNDYNHPSFICYIEAVNNVYNHLRQVGRI